jgi:ribosome maturation factor RimP
MPSKTNRKVIEQTVKNLSGQIIKDLGLELWNVEFYNDAGEYVLEVVIDKPGGFISLDDCEKVTRALNPVLDEADPIEQSYSFAVASPGIGRELKTDSHISKYINKPVTVSLFAKRPDESDIKLDKVFPATLLAYADGSFEFETDGNIIILAKKEVAKLCARDEI